ncbi:MAG: transcription factor, partial [Candidatus Jordarchaeaceae archaeon]
ENRLASYRRTRDTRTGWFIYFWKLNPEKLKSLIISRKQMVFQRLSERLEFEKGNMLFHCGNADCEQLPFEKAMDVSFKCPNCSNTLVFIKNDKAIEILESKIGELKEELKDIKL